MRCFVALVPPKRLIDRLVAWSDGAVGSLEGVRPLPAESLHVTLAFLGELDARACERAGELVGAVAPRPVSMRLEPNVAGVPQRRPKVLAFGERGGEAAGIQAEIAGALIEGELLKAEERPFWSHLSVARVKGGALGGRSGRAAMGDLPSLEPEDLGPHPATRLVLYRSELEPEGAVYTPLAEVALPSGEGL